MRDGLVEQAFGGFAGHDGGAAGAALQEVGAGVQFEAGHGGGFAVALGAFLLEEGEGGGGVLCGGEREQEERQRVQGFAHREVLTLSMILDVRDVLECKVLVAIRLSDGGSGRSVR